MKQSEIERRVLVLWTSTNVPLTPANIQAYSGASRDEVKKALDAMCLSSVAELDSDDDGNLLYTIAGSARIPRGATTVGEAMKMEQLRAEVGGGGSSSSRALVRSGDGDEKSVVASGLLSFFLGPFGLLYAAPVMEAMVPIAVLMGLAAILPTAILSPVLGVLAPVFGVAGVVYAIRHNKNGKRTSLLAPQSSKTKLLR